MANTKEVSSGRIGFLGALTIAFIVLKLTGSIGWSWWWVLAPFWIPWALVGAIFSIIFLVALVGSILNPRPRRRRRGRKRS